MNGANGACTASAAATRRTLGIAEQSAADHASLPAQCRCPAGHCSGSWLLNGDCRQVSYPHLSNDIFWQNRAFHLEVGGTATGGTDYQQSIVTLLPA